MRHFSLFLLLVSFSLNLSAADKAVTPEALVAQLYKTHDAQKSPFFQDQDRALVDRFFAKELADMIWKDAVASQGELGALGADPLYDAQDLLLKDFVIHQAATVKGRTSVLVTFENAGQKKRNTFTFVQQGGVWKISDLRYTAGHTLSRLYRDAAGN
ncbi:DUF3828 domain-containing protein [Prosthecobacter sp.]|uniref:DUF3828 domain-containing protein n=1 Tax=Prosthecobacter sp. TaxID=1965333 RepID=UPI002ABB2847|nr:DUF3828 domain-containing protein [Prosthecobacter sp.]MDZ4404333.1 DUF3828 domain-containing protein [Prosthecobacter sp.]